MTGEELRLFVEELRSARGDNSRIEAKAAETDLPRRLWETLSAFSNASGGGVLILGLDEKSGFALLGIRDPHKIQQDLASVCDHMEPPLRPLIQVHSFEGGTLVTAEIAEVPREQKPCYYKGAGVTNGAFIRVADGDRKLTSYEVQSFIAGRGQPREDEKPVAGATAADLDSRAVRRFVARARNRHRGRYARMSDEGVLRTHKVLVPGEGGVVPSLAGMLIFGRRPDQFFPALGATFVSYPTPRLGEPGPGGERFLDNPPPFHGSLLEAIPALIERIWRNMKQRAVVRGLFREDRWEYPETALREVVVNALVHRDYSEPALGTPVQVQMFPDRLVVVNAGGLFGPVTIDRLGEEGAASARNATLMRILEDVLLPREEHAICENRGSGIGAVLAALRRAGMNPPIFDDRISTFRVTFSNASLLDEATLAWLARIDAGDLTDSQRTALAMLGQGRTMDNATYRNASGLDSRVATQELGDLVQRGFVVQSGTRRWATYSLAAGIPQAEPPKAEGRPQRRRDRREEFKKLLAGGARSRRDLEEATGLSRAAVGYWLRLLIREGVVQPSDRRRVRNVRYRLLDREQN